MSKLLSGYLNPRTGKFDVGSPRVQTAKPLPAAPRVSPQMRDIFRRAQFLYQYSNGIRPAVFSKVDVWRNTGEVAGFYVQHMELGGQHYTERYVWVLRGAKFHEVRQDGVREVAQRKFMGMR